MATTSTQRTWGGLLVMVLTAVVLWWTQGDGSLTSDEPDPTPSPTVSDTPTSSSTPTLPEASDTVAETPAGDVDPESGLTWVADSELPAEALDTLKLIDAGRPYLHDQDDETFQNREGILPDHPEDYYREYTVETPGSDDRGARRIVTGSSGEFYWTDDHYSSFSRIAR